uniref:peptidylprolyl isomerase n=1 Tax=Yersinia enterocolitica TaxID=630 RepID=UPI00313CA8EB
MANKASALHILVDDEKQANDILAQLNNGANFQELAKKFSNCPSKRNGGDLGEFNKGDMVPAFDKAVFSWGVLEILCHSSKILTKRNDTCPNPSIS